MQRELSHDWSTIYLCEELSTGGSAASRVSDSLAGHDEFHILNVATDPATGAGEWDARCSSGASKRARTPVSLATLEVRRATSPPSTCTKPMGFGWLASPNYYVQEQEDALVMVLDL